MKSPPGTSVGPFTTCPPSSFTFSTPAVTSSIEMKIVNGDQTVFELEQMARLRPDEP